jgi:pantoate--beta-alanine ligase
LADKTTVAVLESIDAVRGRLAAVSGTIGLVPTMGALHEGHARLMDLARRDCDFVVVSIFVNPLQFDRDDDLRRYPRTLDQDVEMCVAHNVDVVFAPEANTIYPAPLACTVDVGMLAEHLCGPYRPGHFRAVATVVLKLFEIVRPHRAYFGEKDAQQLAIVRRLVRDLNVGVTIVGVTTVREADGLALSSRNRHLTPEQRAAAPVLYQALSEAQRLIAAGARDAASVIAAAKERIRQHSVLRLEYLEIVDAENLQPVDLIAAPAIVAGALWAGSTRLIDNVSI